MNKATRAIHAAAPKDMQRFWNKALVRDEHQCWPWDGSLHRDYPTISIKGTRCRAHRAAYIWATGHDPGELTIDHECQNHLCVNPAHLKPETNEVNAGITGRNARAVLRRSEAARREAAQRDHNPRRGAKAVDGSVDGTPGCTVRRRQPKVATARSRVACTSA